MRLLLFALSLFIFECAKAQRNDTLYYQTERKTEPIRLDPRHMLDEPIPIDYDLDIPVSCNCLIQEWQNDSIVKYSGDYQWFLEGNRIKIVGEEWFIIAEDRSILFFSPKTFKYKKRIEINAVYDPSAKYAFDPLFYFFSVEENEFVYVYSAKILNSSHNDLHYIFFTPTKGVIRYEDDAKSIYLKPK